MTVLVPVSVRKNWPQNGFGANFGNFGKTSRPNSLLVQAKGGF